MHSPYSVLKQTPSESSHLVDKQRFQVKAILFAKMIHIRSIHGSIAPNTHIFFSLPNDGVCVAFHFGALVLFNVDESEIPSIFNFFAPYAQSIFTDKFQETHEIIVQPNALEEVTQGVLHIKSASREHFEIIADAIAKSVMLDYFESTVASSFAQVEPIAKTLKKSGQLDESSAHLLKYIGASLFTEHEIVGKTELTEKPIVLWEHGELEPLYAQLIEEFEIKDRQFILDNKIELLARTAKTSLDVYRNRHATKLEWYVIILIVLHVLVKVLTITW